MQPVMEPVVDAAQRGRHPAPGEQEGRRAPWRASTRRAGRPTSRPDGRRWPGELEGGRCRRLLARRVQHGGVFRDGARGADRLALAARGADELHQAELRGRRGLRLPDLPHALLHDGRGANKPWLLENADPVTKITWHSWVEVSPRPRRRLDVRDGEIVELTRHGTLECRRILSRPPRDAVAVPLARDTRLRRLRPGAASTRWISRRAAGDFVPYLSPGSARKTGRRRIARRSPACPPARPRHRRSDPRAAAARALGGRGVLEDTAPARGEHRRELEALKGGPRSSPGTRTATTRGHPQWAWPIDLAKCTGCQACVTACYAENNIPTVGEGEILKGRELTWMRIERYWEGGEHPASRSRPGSSHAAASTAPTRRASRSARSTPPTTPPDGSTARSTTGCVGTRYCRQQLPLQGAVLQLVQVQREAWPAPLHLQLNPDVTVRARGVMEKCTFCIQRIREHQNLARAGDRPMRDGEFTTACAQACPLGRDRLRQRQGPGSRVAAEAELPRATTCSRISTPGRRSPTWPRSCTRRRPNRWPLSPRRRPPRGPLITQTHADVTRDVVGTLSPAGRGYLMLLFGAVGCSWSGS
jgi:Fe-S-cluster-containing dehydrogenase component